MTLIIKTRSIHLISFKNLLSSVLVLALATLLPGCTSGSKTDFTSSTSESTSATDSATDNEPTSTNEPIDDVATTPTTVTRNLRAEVVRTEYGIPHVTASDWGGLGYGYGYSYAQDALCLLAKEIVSARGETALYFGDEDNLKSDFVIKMLNQDELIQTDWIDVQEPYLIDLLAGYVAGYNRYLEETGVANLPEGPDGCRDAEWVKPITVLDAAKYFRKLVLTSSSDAGTVRNAIAAAQPAETVVKNTLPLNSSMPNKEVANKTGITDISGKAITTQQLASSINLEPLVNISATGSNAYAFGKETTVNGKGLVLGNPHFPWTGSSKRWYQVHLTIPGVYDVFGASLVGIPAINIGFNSHVAWSHTVSAANRFTLYELKLNPTNPLQYQYDGEFRDMTSQTVTAQIKLDDGTIETREHTFYSSHYGPIVDLGGVSDLIAGWPNPFGTVFAVRDANIDNNRGFKQWVEMGQAKSIDEFVDSLKAIGIPWVNTIAADKDGNAFYGDIAVVPHVTQQQVDTCVRGIISPLLKDESDNQIIALDGSDSACEWGADSDTPAGTNIFGFESLAKIHRTDYVSNSNDSYWLSNPDDPITGLSEIAGAVGWENQQQFFRTRVAHSMVEERLAGRDGISARTKLIDRRGLEKMMVSNRNYGAEILLDDVLSLCSTEPLDVALEEEVINVKEACDVLAAWDRKNDVDSVGPHIFTEFWQFMLNYYEEDYVINDDSLWVTPFDPADPLETPRGLKITDDEVKSAVLQGVATAVRNLRDANVALTQSWGETQYVEKNGEIIPIHGGFDDMGSFGVITSSLEDGGYNNIRHGNSYIQAVTWGDDGCPDARGILTYSLSIDPESPHYTDQTRLYSQKRWADYPYCRDDVMDHSISQPIVLQGSVTSAN